jgi:hypothetical protein
LTQTSNTKLETGKLYRESEDQSVVQRSGTLYVNGPGATGNANPQLNEQKIIPPTSTGGKSRRYADKKGSSASADVFAVSVRGASETDRLVAEKIIEELRGDSGLSGIVAPIRINIEDRTATLMGTVKTEGEKERIVADIRKVAATLQIQNNLKVGITPKDTDRIP